MAPLPLTWIPPEAPPEAFPAVERALTEPDGLLAFGGDLSPARLLAAYRRGIFPWYSEGQPILWWSPDPRAVLFPAEIHVSRSLRKRLRRGGFEVRRNTAFPEVVAGCARARRNTEGTWITGEMFRAYVALHNRGSADSIEVWEDEQLVGGLYGVRLGKVFFGESMFSRTADASKIALVRLCELGFELIDCQVGNDHLARMGARMIGRSEFLRMLARWCVADVRAEAIAP